ncbi:MAG: extracellular solute-binding protein [bacterium]
MDEGRRKFIGAAGAFGAGLLLGGMKRAVFAVPLTGAKLNLRVRQDLVPDAVMNAVLGGFNRKNREIRLVSSYHEPERTWEEENSSLDAVPAKLTEGEDYEMFITHSLLVPDMADAGMIAPLDEYLDDPELNRSDFHRSVYGGVLDSVTYRGNVWALPLVADPYALFCNMAIFDRAGIAFPLKTWNDALDAARKMTIDTDGDGAADLFGYSQCSFQFPLQILTMGLELVDLEKKRVTFDSDEGVEALALYAKLRECSPDHVDFENGDIGMKISVTNNSFGRYGHLDYGIGPLPAGVRRANSYGDSDGALAAGMRKKEKRTRDAAWEAMKWLFSESTFFKLAGMTRSLPLRYSILNGERFKDHLRTFPNLVPFLEELEYAVPKPCVPEYRRLKVIFREILLPVQTVPPALVTREEIRLFLRRMADGANETLSKAAW